MELSGKERANYIAFLKAHTTYKDEDFKKPDDQLFRMYRRIYEAIPEYIKEILAKQEEPTYIGVRFTRQELNQYTYNQLAEIRRSMGIRKQRKRKVVKSEPALSETVEKAKAVVRQITETDLAEQIIEHEEFLDEKELHQAYGDDLPSNEELLAKGIVNLDSNERTFKEILIKRIAIKKAILKVLKEVNNTLPILLPMPIEDIEALEYDDLVKVYSRVCEAIPNIPTLDSFESETKNKLGMF